MNPVLIDETFDSYADQAAFESVWQPANPLNVPPVTSPFGVLVPDFSFIVPPPNDFPPDLQGQAVFIKEALNIYAGPSQPQLEFLEPTPFQAVKLSGDMFDDGLGNKRTTIGLRSVSPVPGAPRNIIELGRFNAPAQDPTDPSIPPASQPPTGFAYRIVLFGPVLPPLLRQPNWQYFPLDPALDGPDEDTLVQPHDIGPGWHRFSAVIGVDFVTLTLDLFRDGLNNAANAPGVDSSVSWPILSFPGAPFNRLQIGGASGVLSAFGSVVDNIRLETIEVIPEPSAAVLVVLGILSGLQLDSRRYPKASAARA